jgi:hypothetical protein
MTAREPLRHQSRPIGMRRPVVVLTLLVAPLLWLGAEPAAACSCVIRSVAEQVQDADVVVTGRLVRQEADRQGVVLSFVGSERYKGDVSPGFEVETSAQSSACGLSGMTEGQRYVVFLQQEGGTLSASSCGGTARARPGLVDQVEAVAGPGTSFTLPPPGAAEEVVEEVVDEVRSWSGLLVTTFRG